MSDQREIGEYDPEYRLVAGKKCYVDDEGDRRGWFVCGSKSGEEGKNRGGYEYYRVENKSIAHHRLLAFAWGMMDDVFNGKEVDHCEVSLRFLNIEWNLQALEQKEHRVITYHRNKARKSDQVQMTLDGDPI